MPPIRLTVAMTHPVQYYDPWFQHVVAHVPSLRLSVFYATDPTPEQRGVEFGRGVEWGIPLREGYPNEVVRPAQPGDDVGAARFFGLDVPGLARAIVRHEPDVVLLPGWHSVTQLRVMAACRLRKIPLLYRGDSNLGSSPGGLRGIGWRARTRLLLQQYAAYLSVGARARAYLTALGASGRPILDSPHCVDNARFAAEAAPLGDAAARRAYRQAHGLREDAFVVLFVGKLAQRKAPLLLVRALAGLPGAQLWVIGAGELEASCRDEARRRGVDAVFAGFFDQRALGPAYAAADCLCLPSAERETWGLVVNEAMACGRPCVVSDAVGCAPDLIEPTRTGETFPVGDEAALCAALERVRAYATRAAPACRAKVDRCSFAAAARGLEEACHAVTGRGTMSR
jgi:glycosyltransferase involved in cell wall biosynthesis